MRHIYATQTVTCNDLVAMGRH